MFANLDVFFIFMMFLQFPSGFLCSKRGLNANIMKLNISLSMSCCWKANDLRKMYVYPKKTPWYMPLSRPSSASYSIISKSDNPLIQILKINVISFPLILNYHVRFKRIETFCTFSSTELPIVLALSFSIEIICR